MQKLLNKEIHCILTTIYSNELLKEKILTKVSINNKHFRTLFSGHFYDNGFIITPTFLDSPRSLLGIEIRGNIDKNKPNEIKVISKLDQNSYLIMKFAFIFNLVILFLSPIIIYAILEKQNTYDYYKYLIILIPFIYAIFLYFTIFKITFFFTKYKVEHSLTILKRLLNE